MILKYTPIIIGINAEAFKMCKHLIALALPNITGRVLRPAFESEIESFRSKNIAFIIPFRLMKIKTMIN